VGLAVRSIVRNSTNDDWLGAAAMPNFALQVCHTLVSPSNYNKFQSLHLEGSEFQNAVKNQFRWLFAQGTDRREKRQPVV